MTADSIVEKARFHAIVTGFVQGVSFRYYTQKRAAEAGVAGWVRNLRDGSVEVTAEGGRAALDLLAEFLCTGPPAAQVSNLAITWQEATGEFRGFEVRY